MAFVKRPGLRKDFRTKISEGIHHIVLVRKKGTAADKKLMGTLDPTIIPEEERNKVKGKLGYLGEPAPGIVRIWCTEENKFREVHYYNIRGFEEAE